ncbi:unnamed protein product [Camellia sinensis]
MFLLHQFLLLFLLSYSFASHTCLEDQRFSLLQFKTTFTITVNASSLRCGSDSHPKMVFWNESSDCCSWEGVTCDWSNGQVIGVDLSCSHLQGTIQPNSSLFHLRHLQTLNLAFNDFNLSGISLDFGSFPSLTHLNLSHSSFTGGIPLKICHLSKLISLDLSDMGYYSPALNSLYLRRCNFSGSIPASLWNLTQITGLDIGYNSFGGQIPSSISNLAKLTNLGLSGTNLNGQIPDSLGNMSQLTSLYLSDNSLNGTIPSWLFALSSLVEIELNNYKLQGPIPGLVYELQNLTDLLLSSNNLSGLASCNLSEFPNFLREQARLRFLDLSNNKIHGEVPKWSFNNLYGEIPLLICCLSSLQVLDLSNNSLSGLIPQCLGNLSLSVLNLGINSFSGTFTTTFTKGNWLRNLNLNGNQIEGQVPRSLLNCEYLEVLDFGKNKINDTFSHWLETLIELKVLVLRFNRFHGHIGTSKTKGKHPFPKLRIIDISCNEFIGLLPTNYIKQFGAMMNVDEHVKFKYMGETYYQDSVVVVMKGNEIEYSRILTVFSIIDFSRNKFQGEIPKSIGRLNSLRGLNLSHNNLKGHIPTSLGNLKNLESLDLSSNKFVGEIPQQLKSLMFLEILNLSNNQLAGPIPQGSYV